MMGGVHIPEAPTSFVLGGVTHEFADPGRQMPIGTVCTWTPGEWPKVHAQVPLQAGGTVEVYGEATAWTPEQIHIRWDDDNKDTCQAWLPAFDVRRVTDSEWDIDQYNRTPEWSRPTRWGHRLPGFLPE